MLVILSGLPGVGKTAIAQELARTIGAVHLRIDSIEQALRRAGYRVEGEGYEVAYAVAEDNLRAGRTGTAVLMGRVFFNAYLAGQGTEWEKLAEDQYDQLFAEAMNVVGVGVSSNVVGKLLGKVGAKATTGYLNRILLVRLGRYATRLLRPVARD